MWKRESKKKRISALFIVQICLLFSVTSLSLAYSNATLQSIISTLTLGAFTYTYDTATPVGTDAPSVIDDRIREVKQAVQERMNVDHYWPLTGTQVSDADGGYHRDIHFYSTTGTDPILGVTAVSGTDELQYTDSGSSSVQLTSGGYINGAVIKADTIGAGSIQLANNTYLKAANNAGDGEVNLIKANTSDVAVIPDGSELATSAAPTADADIANKKYVDDNIGSANYTPTAYAGQESVTLPNGLILKMGVESVAAYATDDVTYAAAFSNGVVAAFATYKTTENSYTATANAIPKSGLETSILQVVNGVNATVNIAWLVIGY
jgi:hypothetical protein